MKTPLKTVAPILAVGSLALSVQCLSAISADLPWTYDTSKRVEPVPVSQESSATGLFTKAQDAAMGAADWLSSLFQVREFSAGTDLSTEPLRFILFLR